MNGTPFIRRWRLRVLRLWHHHRFPGQSTDVRPFVPQSPAAWLGEWLCYMADVLWAGEIWQSLLRLLKPNHRRLDAREMAIARSVFAHSLDYTKIWLDNRSLLAMPRYIEAFVSFSTINYRSHITDAVLVHELVHVWQYQKFGSIYLALAYRAHKSPDVYEYGGPRQLYRDMWKGKKFTDYTVEQQAEIVEDYYRILTSERSVSPLEWQAFECFILQLQAED